MSQEQSLHLKQHQGVYLSAQLIEGISLVAMSAQELVEYVHDNIDRNPFLEEVQNQGQDAEQDADQDADQYPDQYSDQYQNQAQVLASETNASFSPATNLPTYDCRPSADELSQKLVGRGQLFGDGSFEKTKQDYPFEQYLTQQPTMEEYLLEQLDLELTKDIDIIIGQYLIGNLDQYGYLRVSVAEVASTLRVTAQQVEQVLSKLQKCSSAGIGARNLQEYLLLQLQASSKATPLATQIISEHLEDLANGKFKAVSRQLTVPLAAVQETYDLIRSFSAHPDLPINTQHNLDIWPEVVVVKQGDGFLVSMQDVYLPKLTINQEYVALSNKPGIDTTTANYLKTEHKSAQALIEGISLRRQSIFKVAACIVERQSQFMAGGIGFLLPLTMAQVAAATGLSESTVSRVANGNYLQTPQGVFELRSFFSSGVAQEAGQDVSSKSVKHLISEMVANENPAQPLSDLQIQEALASQQICISRRTVNKYRTSLGIPTNTLRRRFG